MDPRDILREIKDKDVKFVDVCVIDILGRLKCLSFPSRHFKEEFFVEGVGFDGSSIRGFVEIHESDMVALPDPNTFFIDPIDSNGSTRRALFLARVYYPGLKRRLETDPKYIVERVQSFLDKRGLIVFVSPELEFFIFNSFDPKNVFLNLFWDNLYEPKLYSVETDVGEGYFSSPKDGYFNPPPFDRTMEYRIKLYEALYSIGIDVVKTHHEVAASGQVEINLKYGEPEKVADDVIKFKYIARRLANSMNLLVTFMPKPIYGDNGSGMHIHLSLWKDGKNLFFDESDEYAEISDIARYFIGGILKHAKALAALGAPTVNSYKRLVPGFEAPVYICWSRKNRSALVRIPLYRFGDSIGKRIEIRFPDPTANPYIVFSALIAAGIDGIERKIEPPDPIDLDVYSLSFEKRKALGIDELPGSLGEALDYLEEDKLFEEWLGKVFVEKFLEIKREEWKKFLTHITLWEYINYLNI